MSGEDRRASSATGAGNEKLLTRNGKPLTPGPSPGRGERGDGALRAPFDASPDRYHHSRTGEDDAHLKRQVMGREVVVAITACKLDFGPWEQIYYYGEFEGRRAKRVRVKVIGE